MERVMEHVTNNSQSICTCCNKRPPAVPANIAGDNPTLPQTTNVISPKIKIHKEKVARHVKETHRNKISSKKKSPAVAASSFISSPFLHNQVEILTPPSHFSRKEIVNNSPQKVRAVMKRTRSNGHRFNDPSKKYKDNRTTPTVTTPKIKMEDHESAFLTTSSSERSFPLQVMNIVHFTL
jgi:hypothetical protein